LFHIIDTVPNNGGVGAIIKCAITIYMVTMTMTVHNCKRQRLKLLFELPLVQYSVHCLPKPNFTSTRIQ